MTLITPYLPNEAIAEIKAWQKLGHPAFQVAVDQGPKTRCKNCGDMGRIFIRLIDGGPYRAPMGLKNVSTWFDGDGHNGKGWYTVNKTLEYTCPRCLGMIDYVEPEPNENIRLSVQEDIGYLTENMKHPV